MKFQCFRFLVCLLTIATLSSSEVRAVPIVYSLGHADIGLAYLGGELELHYHFGNGAVLDGVPLVGDLESDPGDAIVRVSDAAIQFPGAVPFLGTGASDPVWVLPQSNTGGLPFLGIAAEELDGFGFTSATISLSDYQGPGQFALWQGGFTPNVIWQTSDGLTGGDLLNVAIGGHDHYNYSFTAAGVYDLELTAQANFSGGGFITDTEVFRFVVGSSTVVPEPSGLVALAAIGIGAIGRRRGRANSCG